MYIHKSLTSQAGFTIVEILVVVTILALMMGGAIVSFINYRDQQATLVEAAQVAELLRKTQSKASATELPVGCSGVRDYVVAMSGTGLRVTVECDSGNTALSDMDYNLTTSTFVGNYTITFDSRTVAATPTNIDMCGNHYLYRVNVNNVAFVARPTYQGGC